jgi:hypothetical protein
MVVDYHHPEAVAEHFFLIGTSPAALQSPPATRWPGLSGALTGRGGGFRDQALNEGSAAALIDRRLVGASNGSRLWGQIKEKVVWA